MVRLDGALLVARTAAHRLNNGLTPVVGFAELLAAHRAIAEQPALAARARQIVDGSLQAAREVRRLQRLIRSEEDTTMDLPWPVLDLDRSTSPVPAGAAGPAALPEPALTSAR